MDRLFIIIQSLIVYMTIMAVLYNGGKKSANTGRIQYALYAILFYAILFGLRYAVGADTNSYIEEYDRVQQGILNERNEAGFLWLEKLSASIGVHSTVFFGGLAFIQLMLVYYALRKDKYVYPYIALTFILGCVWLTYANGIRQAIALTIYFVALGFSDKKHFYFYFALVFIASLFHKSAIILFATFLLLSFNKDLFPSRKFQYILFIVAIALGNLNIVTKFMDGLEIAATYFGYDYYFDGQYSESLLRGSDSNGIGYYVNLLLPTLTIYYSPLLKKEIPNITKPYNVYFIGVILKYAFINSPLIQRVNYYFYGFEFIIIAFLLYVLHRHNHQAFRVVVVTLCLVFVGTLYRCFDNYSAFFFIGQEDLYRLLTGRLR